MNQHITIADITATTKSLIWSAIVAALAYMVTIFVLSNTQAGYLLNDALQNGHGPYEIGLIIVVLLIFIRNLDRIWSTFKHAFRTKRLTIADQIAVAIFLWGIAPWQLMPNPTIDWRRLSQTLRLAQILWVIVSGLLVVRLSYISI